MEISETVQYCDSLTTKIVDPLMGNIKKGVQPQRPLR